MTATSNGSPGPTRFGEGLLFAGIGATVTFILVLTVGLAIVATGLAESDGRAATGGDLSGEQLYEQQCAVCHGDAGQGNIGPQLAGVVADKYPQVAIHVRIVEDGRGAMPAFRSKLSADEIAAVVEFERTELGQ
jgi:mono/diheme cytochrome c family protein